jgi:hypothetical protein
MAAAVTTHTQTTKKNFSAARNSHYKLGKEARPQLTYNDVQGSGLKDLAGKISA